MTTDQDSVWHKFTDRNMSVMRGERANHPSRQIAYDIIRSHFDKSRFEWLDVGIVGMVDYERLKPVLDFAYTGVDISSAVIEDSQRYISSEEDRLVPADFAIDANRLPEVIHDRKYDLVTLRAVLNHMTDVNPAINNAAHLLSAGGICIMTMHIPLTESDSRIEEYWGYPTEEPGKVIRHYLNRRKFIDIVNQHFDIERFIRIKDSYKSQDVIAARMTNPDGLNRSDNYRIETIHTRSLAYRMIRDAVPIKIRRRIAARLAKLKK